MIIKQQKKGVDCYLSNDRPKTKSRLEWVEGVDLYQHATHKFDGIEPVFFHVANESQSKPQYRQKLKQQGLTAGVSDYLLLAPRGGYHYLAIELKRARVGDSAIRDEQITFIEAVSNMGGYGCICYGYKAALHVIELYLNEMIDNASN